MGRLRLAITLAVVGFVAVTVALAGLDWRLAAAVDGAFLMYVANRIEVDE